MAHPTCGRRFGMRLESGGDKSSNIFGVCSDSSLVASYSGPNFF